MNSFVEKFLSGGYNGEVLWKSATFTEHLFLRFYKVKVYVGDKRLYGPIMSLWFSDLIRRFISVEKSRVNSWCSLYAEEGNLW